MNDKQLYETPALPYVKETPEEKDVPVYGTGNLPGVDDRPGESMTQSDKNPVPENTNNSFQNSEDNKEEGNAENGNGDTSSSTPSESEPKEETPGPDKNGKSIGDVQSQLQLNGGIVSTAVVSESPSPSPSDSGGEKMSLSSVLIIAVVILLAVCVGILLRMIYRQKKIEKQQRIKTDRERRKKELRRDNGNEQMPVAKNINSQRVGQVLCGIAQTIGAREQQQDSVYCSNWKDQDVVRARGILAAVSDGIGGLKDGNLASQGAMQAMRAAFLEDTGGFAAPDRLLNYAAAAQNKVLEINRTGNRCGATLVTVLITGREMNFLSIGDSRICLYRSGALLQLNREHVLGRQNAEKESLYNSGERLTAKRAGALTSYLGKEDLTLIDRSLQAMKLLSGDVILLMSDGVFNTLNDDELISLIRQEPQAAADAIIDAVEERANPRQDNATVLVIGIG